MLVQVLTRSGKLSQARARRLEPCRKMRGPRAMAELNAKPLNSWCTELRRVTTAHYFKRARVPALHKLHYFVALAEKCRHVEIVGRCS